MTGKGQSVCVIDTGIDYEHNDFGGCDGVSPECEKIPLGYNYVSDNEDPFDGHGHGTHVAGIVAANGNIKGVAPDASLVIVKALSDAGLGDMSDVLKGIEFCINNSEEYNISVISMSLGTISYLNSTNCDNDWPSFSSVVNQAYDKNISVVAAAGNSNNYTQISFPACLEKVIPVTATTKSDSFATYANRNELVRLAAPGSSINSTWINDSYNFSSGTSMATPHVSGAIAIINQYLGLRNKFMTPAKIEELLADTGRVLYDSASGQSYARINITGALMFLEYHDFVLVESFSLSPGEFFCSLDESWNVLSFDVSIVDYYGNVNSVFVNLSELGAEPELLELSYDEGSKAWLGNASFINTSGFDFQRKNISLLLLNSAGEPIEFSGVNYTSVILYNLSSPEFEDPGCFRLGAESTNFCSIADFSNVSLDLIIEANGSSECYPEREADFYWVDDFKPIASISFSGLDLSEDYSGSLLKNITKNIAAGIVAPAEFGKAFVSVNTSIFEELDRKALVSLYGLGFTSEPYIEAPGGKNVSGVSYVMYTPSQNFSLMNISFNVPGFSAFYLYDNFAPSLEVAFPEDKSFLNYSSSISIIVNANGTGTLLSNITMYLNSSGNLSVISYNHSDIPDNCLNLSVSYDSVSCSFLFDELDDGNYSISAFSYDFGPEPPGNANSVNVSFTIDTIAPSIDIVYPRNGSLYNTSELLLNISAFDANLEAVEYSLNNGGEKKAYTEPTLINAVEGENIVEAWAVDKAGNTNYSSVSFSVDTIAPSLEIVFPGNDGLYNTSEILLNISASDANLEAVGYSLNGGENQTYESPEVVNVSQGDNIIIVWAIDCAGNRNHTSISFFIDTISPVANFSVSPLPAYVGMALAFNGSLSYDVNGIESYAWLFHDDSASNKSSLQKVFHKPGNYSVLLNVRDPIGNSNSLEKSVEVKKAVLSEPVAPNLTISSVNLSPTPVGFFIINISEINSNVSSVLVYGNVTPNGTGKPDGLAMPIGYFEINLSGSEENAVVFFRIPQIIIDDMQITNLSLVSVFLYDGEGWLGLDTAFSGFEAGYAVFSFVTPHFSLFAYGIRNETELSDEDEDDDTQPAGRPDGGGAGAAPVARCVPEWECSEWSECIEGQQQRECIDANECGTEENKPAETRECECIEYWVCSEWSECLESGFRLRECEDVNQCGTNEMIPVTKESCGTDPSYLDEGNGDLVLEKEAIGSELHLEEDKTGSLGKRLLKPLLISLAGGFCVFSLILFFLTHATHKGKVK